MKLKHFISIACFSISACAAPSSDSENGVLLVGNKGENTVSFIDLKSGVELTRISTSARSPHEIAISPDNTQAAVVNYGDAAIDILDIASRRLIKTIDLGENRNPHGIIWLKDGRIIATTEGGKSIVIIENETVTPVLTNQDGTHMVAAQRNGHKAYTTNLGSGTISAIQLSPVIKVSSKPAGSEIEGIALTQDEKEIWVSIRGENKVLIFSPELEQLAEMEVGPFPLRIIVSPDGRKMVTSNLLDGSITVIDVTSRKVDRTIKVSGSRNSQQVTLLFSEDGLKLYAAETGKNTVAEIDFKSGEVLRRFNAGRQGDGLAIVP